MQVDLLHTTATCISCDQIMWPSDEWNWLNCLLSKTRVYHLWMTLLFLYRVDIRFWQYHLHPNSNISVSVCTDLLVDVYIVKGNDNANSWANNPSQDLAEMFQYAPACCNDLPNTSTISYRVEQEDEYYVIRYQWRSFWALLYTLREQNTVPLTWAPRSRVLSVNKDIA